MSHFTDQMCRLGFMFTNRIHLFTLLGFKVSLDLTWFLLAVLIVWSLASGYFPMVVEGLEQWTYWWMGIVGAVGLFASIVFHEFAHAMVARYFGMPISGITLFIFGGVAELDDEPPSPKIEFLVAIAGPIASYLLALGCFVLLLFLPAQPPLGPGIAILGYLVFINALLATFNLIPAFPLDGGRILRAAVWWKTNDLRRATQVGAFMGRMMGWLLIVLGVANILSGNSVGGIWQILIGFFIVNAAGMSEMQMEVKLGLQKLRVRDLMSSDPIEVPAALSVRDAVEGYFYRYFHKGFPVTRDGALIGWLRLEDVGKLDKGLWREKTVGDVIENSTKAQHITSDAPMSDALEMMRKHDTARLMVVDRQGDLVGVVTQRDIMDYLTVRNVLDKAHDVISSPGRPSQSSGMIGSSLQSETRASR